VTRKSLKDLRPKRHPTVLEPPPSASRRARQCGNAMMLLALTGVSTALGSCGKSNSAEVTLVNDAHLDVARCEVKLDDASTSVNVIASDTSVAIVLPVRADAHYIVNLQFANGDKLHAELGYVTSGFKYKDTLTIHRNGIDLTSTQVSE
jgi:hypothetical protein